MILNDIRLCLVRCRAQLNINRKYAKASPLSIKLNSTMKELISSEKYLQALDLFDQQRPICTNMTFTLALKASTKLSDQQRGIRIHKQLTSKSLEDPFILTSLIHFYMQCHLVEDAQRIFSTIPNKTIFMYGAMFKGYISNNMPEKVLELFEKISINIDEVIITLLFNACTKLSNDSSIKFGNDVLNRLPNCFLQHEKLVNSAIHMLMKFGDIDQAERLFRQMKIRRLVTSEIMMQGYVKNDRFEKALDFFEETSLRSSAVLYTLLYSVCASLCNERAMVMGKKSLAEMPEVFVNDPIVVNSAIHMLMKLRQVEEAEFLFKRMKRLTLYTYGIMINGYKINNQPDRCFALLKQMNKEKMIINEPIALSLVGACSQIGVRSISEKISQQISHLQPDLPLKTSLIDMWGKSGDIHRATEIFQSISQPDVSAYNSLIHAYGRNGMGYEAIEVYQHMPENIRNTISHICLLNACSHSALLDQARNIFSQIKNKTEDIFITMVDCLSRMGIFDQAQELIDEYEKSNSPSLIMYMAVLSGARNHRQTVLSATLYDRMRDLFPEKKQSLIAASILVSNTYSSVGDDRQAEKVRLNRIKAFGNDVRVGLSWTEVDGELVRFKAHDRSHPRSAEIYAELDRLSNELKEHGHQYDSSWMTRSLKDGETIETVLCGHSEKLAIAFNFIQQRRPTFIQITKNLRVCGDCHRATKLIAKIRQCQIVVRDANRIHHFHPNGQCSCQDHF